MSYTDLIIDLGYSPELANISKGRVEAPLFTVEAPINPSFGFPPMLLPLWSSEGLIGYIGIAKHWFGAIQDSFVQYYAGEHDYLEIARNFEQLKAWMVFDFYRNVPAPDEVARFSKSIGFRTGSELKDVFHGVEGVTDLTKLEEFCSNVPAAVEYGIAKGQPQWLGSQVNVDQIVQKVDAGDLEAAWIGLNSSRLDPSATLMVLNRLAPHVENESESFSKLIECWSEAHAIGG